MLQYALGIDFHNHTSKHKRCLLSNSLSQLCPEHISLYFMFDFFHFVVVVLLLFIQKQILFNEILQLLLQCYFI